MPLIWLSAICMVLIVTLLVLGERTLPLFGGDRELAGRVYKTVFMLLGTGVVAGLFPAVFRFFAGFARTRAASNAYPEMMRFAAQFFEATGPWFAAMVGMSGVGLAIYVWFSQ